MITARLLVAGLIVMLAAGCASDPDGGSPQASTVFSDGSAALASLGGISVQLSAAGIGPAATQVPSGARLRISAIEDFSAAAATSATLTNANPMGPAYSTMLTTAAGGLITNRTVAEPYTITLVPDPARLEQLDLNAASLRVVRRIGTSYTVMPYAASPVTDTSYSVDGQGRVVVRVTRLGDFMLIRGAVAADPATVLSGTLTEIAGVLAFNLSAGNGDTVVMGFPTSSATTLPATITANPESFNTANPTATSNRSVVLSSGGVTFASYGTNGQATITLSTRTGGVSTGSITGTLVSGSGLTRSVVYSFATTVTGGSGASIAMEGTRFDVATTASDGHAVAACWNGNDFVVSWLGPDGANGRMLSSKVVSPTGQVGTTTQTVDALATFAGGTALRTAYGDDNTRRRILAIGTNSANASAAVIGLLLDHTGAPLNPNVELEVATAGGFPQVAWSTGANRFAVAWATAAEIRLAAYDTGGVRTLDPILVSELPNARVTSVVAAGSGNSILVCYSDGTTGVKARRFDVMNGAAGGAEFSLSTAGGGGVASLDPGANAWLVAVESGQQRTVVRVATDGNAAGPNAGLLLPGTLVAAVPSQHGVIFADQNAIPNFGAAFSFQGAAAGATNPTAFAAPFSPQLQGGVGFPFHDASGAIGVASNGQTRVLVAGIDRDGAGLRAYQMLVSGD